MLAQREFWAHVTATALSPVRLPLWAVSAGVCAVRSPTACLRPSLTACCCCSSSGWELRAPGGCEFWQEKWAAISLVARKGHIPADTPRAGAVEEEPEKGGRRLSPQGGGRWARVARVTAKGAKWGVPGPCVSGHGGGRVPAATENPRSCCVTRSASRVSPLR